jgi:CheY-like chemotaxis protein
MKERLQPLFVLLVDDEEDVLQQLVETLPVELEGYGLVWDKCPSFDEALSRLESRRYDMVVTDLAFRTKPGEEPDFQGLKTIKEIRGRRFCPVVAYSTRSKPEELSEDPFVRFADKAHGNDDIVAKIREVLNSGIPGIARRLHDELDGMGGTYLWDFLAKRWTDLKSKGVTTPDILERLIRRRAATQLARMQGDVEIGEVTAAEFYLCPKISGDEYRLGEIIRRKNQKEYRVILTPHCYLVVQAGQQQPRADHILTLGTVRASSEIATMISSHKEQFNLTKEQKRVRAIQQFVKSPPRVGKPEGRYWFLPGFLEMPDLYCDFMQAESLSMDTIRKDYEPFAVLDTPFAEALQAYFGEFYSAVGTPDLRIAEFLHLLPQPQQ